ncbi:hypothetical protein [Psychrobacter pygoscelis]|uniref:hypothetical protein n=1 Tax=Psychrobacter pygoscelis TaxID=2488563 RepID=UPI00103DE90E|nr:hypothetical protein [Psychrobacter pygoscelis]
MNKLTLPLSILALCFATSSYANTQSRQSLRVETERHLIPCDYHYQQALQYQLMKRDRPITINKEKSQYINELRKFAEEHYMPADITDLPKYDDLDSIRNQYNIGSEQHNKTVNINDHVITQEEAVTSLFKLYAYYFTGEYVPKDDYLAITYLAKLVDFYERDNPSRIPELLAVSLLAFVSNDINEDNPVYGSNSEEFSQVIDALLLRAGSTSIKASLIRDDFYHSFNSDESCRAEQLNKLEVLANEGSVYATFILAELYSELNDDSGKYKEKLNYWQQRADAYDIEP